MENVTVKVFKSGKMGAGMKATGKTIWLILKVVSFTLMVTIIKEIGLMTKLRGMVLLSIIKELSILVIGITTNKMEKVLKNGLMVLFFKASSSKDRKMDVDISNGQTGRFSMENFKITISKDVESTHGLMVEITMVSGK